MSIMGGQAWPQLQGGLDDLTQELETREQRQTRIRKWTGDSFHI